MKWIWVYAIVGGGSVGCYFLIRDYLIDTGIHSFLLSNLTLNLLLLTMGWGAACPLIFRRRSFLFRWGATLGGFILIILVLTATGTHTRITDLFGGVK
jgi:hypothetical protein